MNDKKHWISAPLSILTILRKGKKPAKLASKKFDDCVPYLDIQAIEKNIIKQFADSYSTLLSTKDDIFIVADGARSGLVGKGKEGAVGSTLICITTLGIDSAYLYYFLKLKYNDLNNNNVGSTIPHLNIDFFNNLNLPFPSLEEQKRIVVELQNQLLIFEKDFSNASIELAKLNEFKKSVLNEAVIGKLTKKFRQINPQTNLPNDWKITTIEEVSTFIGSGITPSGGSTNYKDKGIPFIRSQNVYPNELRISDIAYISEEMHLKMKRTQIKPKDVLLNITGASIGRSAYIPNDFGEANVNQHVCIIRVKDEILPEYLSLFLNSPIGQDNINSIQKGVTRQALNYDQIRGLQINLPSLDEQIEIVQNIKLQEKSIQELEKVYSETLTSTNDLENAVLKMAFDGNLSKPLSDDSLAADILKKLKDLKSEKLKSFDELKLLQNKKMLSSKIKIDKKSLIKFISDNYIDKTFTSDELYKKLDLGDQYDKYIEVFFHLLQKDEEGEMFLETIYDEEGRRQIFKILKK